MFTSLESIIGPLNKENLLLCVDQTKGRSGFLNHHFISYGISRQMKVVLVGLDQTFGHYHSVGMKLGYNLHKLREEGSVVFVDGTKMILPSVLGVETIFSPERGLEEFFLAVSKLLSDNCILIIDNISVLSALGFSSRELLMLMSKLTDQVERLAGQMLCTVSGEPDSFTNSLHRRSAITFTVQDLSTGKSRDVSGHLNIKRRVELGEFEAQDFHFRIEEKNVRIFPPGTSSAVL